MSGIPTSFPGPWVALRCEVVGNKEKRQDYELAIQGIMYN